MKSSTMQYQKYLSLLIFIISLNSCTTWHYTNYGKPFDFLKAQRFSHRTQVPSSEDVVQPFSSIAKIESKKSILINKKNGILLKKDLILKID